MNRSNPDSKASNMSADDWLHQGQQLIREEKFEEAIPCFDAEIAMRYDESQALGYKSQCLHFLGRKEEASRCTDLAIAHDNIQFFQQQAEKHRKEGKYEEAIAYLNKLAATLDGIAIAEHKKDAILYHALRSRGKTLADWGKYDEAIDLYNQLIDCSSSCKQGIFWMDKGRCYLKKGKNAAALNCYKMAERSESGLTMEQGVEFEMAAGLDEMGKYEEALAYYNEALRKYKHWLYYVCGCSRYSQACCLMSLKRYEEAITSFNKILKIDCCKVEESIEKKKICYSLINEKLKIKNEDSAINH